MVYLAQLPALHTHLHSMRQLVIRLCTGSQSYFQCSELASVCSVPRSCGWGRGCTRLGLLGFSESAQGSSLRAGILMGVDLHKAQLLASQNDSNSAAGPGRNDKTSQLGEKHCSLQHSGRVTNPA